MNYSSGCGVQILHINDIKIDKLLASRWVIRESSTDSRVYQWSAARMSWEIQSANGLDGVWNVKGAAVSCCVPFAAEATLIWSIRLKRRRGDSDSFLISAAGDDKLVLHWEIIAWVSSSTFWLCQHFSSNYTTVSFENQRRDAYLVFFFFFPPWASIVRKCQDKHLLKK